jgi:hypothetical protein
MSMTAKNSAALTDSGAMTSLLTACSCRSF